MNIKRHQPITFLFSLLRSFLVDADDFLPIFIFLLTLSRLHHPATCLTYIQQLTPSMDMAGELSYYVTTFESAVYFITQILIDLSEDGMIHAGVDVSAAMRCNG